jgi:site-specific DNA-methyltransferase (adenine-specific)
MWIYSSGFPKSQDVGRSIQRSIGVKEYEGFVDTTKNSGFGQTDHARVRAGEAWSTPATQVGQVKVTDPEALAWSGWGTALKPAHEPIALARKPMKSSIAKNCQTHGVGALNIDAVRVLDKFPSNVLGEILQDNYQKYFYCPKVSRRERHIEEQVDNNHPTVKPIELMKYLIKLITPAGGIVLDPFNGSGSTGCAAVELGCEYVGIELDPAYVEIATKRIEAWNREETNFKELFQ